MSRRRPWVLLLLLAALAAALVSEWAARRIGGPLPAHNRPRCAIVRPAPAIGAESGASTITADYERHPTLGWVPTERSPHHPDTARIPRDGGDWIALFGDASITGASGLPDGALAARLGPSLTTPVVSYAVAGHGLEHIVARYADTLATVDSTPRTTLVGFRVDAIERLADTPPSEPPPRSHLLGLIRARWTQQPSGAPDHDDTRDCVHEPNRLQLRNLLTELRATAEQRGVELVVSLHAPAAPGPEHMQYLELLHHELDALNIHRIDAWDANTARGTREQSAFAAAQLERRLEHAADYIWGKRIGFGKREGAEHHGLSGFSGPHDAYRWMTSRVAWLDLSPPPSAGGIVATIEFRRAMTFEGDPRELVLRVGRVAVGRWPLRQLRKNLEDSFYIDEGLAAVRPLEFRFELESLRSAHELGIGKSKRKIGVAIAALTLAPEHESARSPSP